MAQTHLEQKKMLRTTQREITDVGPQKANPRLEIRAHSSLTQAKEAKERDELVHLRQQAHRTAIRKVTERVVLC